MWAGSMRGPAGAAGTLPGEADAPAARRRRSRSRSGRNPSRSRRHRRRPAGAVQLAQQISDKVTQANEAVLRIRDAEGRRSPIARRARRTTRRSQAAGAGAGRQAHGDRRRDLPVPEPQQPGSAELPDQAEQQAGGAAGHRRERRRQADRSVLRRVQGPVGPARRAAREARQAAQDRTARREQGVREEEGRPGQVETISLRCAEAGVRRGACRARGSRASPARCSAAGAPARFGKSTRSSSWSWLKQEKMIVSLPVTGSTCFCRHCAQTSFIMHCIGELMLPMPTWSGFRYGCEHAVARRLHRGHHAVRADGDDAVDGRAAARARSPSSPFA